MNTRRTSTNGKTSQDYNQYQNPYNPTNNNAQYQNLNSFPMSLFPSLQSSQNLTFPSIGSFGQQLGFDILQCQQNQSYKKPDSLLLSENPNTQRTNNNVNYVDVGLGELPGSFSNPNDVFTTTDINELSLSNQVRNYEGVVLFPNEASSKHPSHVSIVGKRKRHGEEVDLFSARERPMNRFSNLSQQPLPIYKNQDMRETLFPNNLKTVEVPEVKNQENFFEQIENSNYRYVTPNSAQCVEERKQENQTVTAEKVVDLASPRYSSPCIFQSSEPSRFLCYEYPLKSDKSLRAQTIRAFHALYISTDIVTMETSFLALMSLSGFDNPEKFVSFASNRWNSKGNGDTLKLPEGTSEATSAEFFQIIVDASIAIPHLLRRSLKEFLTLQEPNGPGISPENAITIVNVLVRDLKVKHIQDALKLREQQIANLLLDQDGNSILFQSTVKLVLEHLYRYAEKSKTRAMLVRDLIVNGNWPGHTKENSYVGSENHDNCEGKEDKKLAKKDHGSFQEAGDDFDVWFH